MAAELAEFIINLKAELNRKRFVVRGAPFAKKMWRDGYNKCLDDVATVVAILQEKAEK